jgi:hypothetical protein
MRMTDRVLRRVGVQGMCWPRTLGAGLALLAVLAVACASTSGSGGAGSPGFNGGGPMEVHGSPTAQGGASGGSTSTGEVTVPDLRGLPFEDAAKTLLHKGFEFGEVVAVADGQARWSVISQTPTAGVRMPKGGAVSLRLSLGPNPPEAVHQLACRPEEDELDDPYCIGKLLKY